MCVHIIVASKINAVKQRILQYT